MHRTTFLLFAIPFASMLVIALYGFFNEMFKKNFVLERRGGASTAPKAAGAPKRRYSDTVAAGTPRGAESEAAKAAEVAAAQTHGV
jgi:hypothetical protein